MKLTRLLPALAAAVLGFHFSARADLKLAAIFGDNMVLQQQQRVPIWGWSTPGAAVTVRFSGQSKSTHADADGKWLVKLAKLKASAGPQSLVIESGDTKTLMNILVGEVWLACGLPTPWGDVTGAGVTLTFGYSSAGASVQLGPILESVSPLYGLYSDKGAGSLSLTPSTHKCTVGTLNGVYMFQLNGSQLGPFGWLQYTDSGRFQADGKGNLTVVDSGNSGGTVFAGRTFPIVYTVNDDCSGAFAFGSNAMDIQLSLDGKAINMVFTKPSTVNASGVGRQQ